MDELDSEDDDTSSTEPQTSDAQQPCSSSEESEEGETNLSATVKSETREETVPVKTEPGETQEYDGVAKTEHGSNVDFSKSSSQDNICKKEVVEMENAVDGKEKDNMELTHDKVCVNKIF